MATKTRLSIALFVGAAFGAGCTTSSGTGGDGNDGGAGTTGGVGGTGGSGDNPAPVVPTGHPRIYLGANRARLTASLAAHTPAATRLQASVDQWVAGADLWGFQAWTAALLGQLTANPAYCGKAVATIEAQVVAAEAKIAANQAPDVAGDSYLGIGTMIGDLAVVYDWCFDRTTPGQRTRWLAYADQAVWNVWHHADAKWGTATLAWSGWAVDDPSDNYYYQFLRATMMLGLASKGDDPQADAWLAQFRDAKITSQLVPTFTADLVGGGSREGSGYGVAMDRLFELYDVWKATTGESLAIKTPHTRASMLAMLHQLVPTRDRVAPTGDLSRDSTAAFFDYHRNYLQELIQQFPGDSLAARAKSQLEASSVPQMANSFMLVYDFTYDNANVTAQPIDGLNTAYYAPGIGELYTRSGWDSHATWLNLIAGPYTQSHAHQDQGALMLYKDGWLAYDAVVSSHSGLTQATTAHSLVRIDSGGQPVRQVASTISHLTALHHEAGFTYASSDLTPAYDGNPAVQAVRRDLVYLTPDVVVVFDRVRSAAGSSQTWQLVTPVAPAISGATAAIRNAGHVLTVSQLAGGSMAVTAMSSVDADFTDGYRVDERLPGGDNRYLHVLAIDGSVSSMTAAGDAAHPGVSLALAGGHHATVTFAADAPGATIVLDGATKSLGAGVDSLPE